MGPDITERDKVAAPQPDIVPDGGSQVGEQPPTMAQSTGPAPHLAAVDALWTRPVRALVVTLVILATVGYAVFGTVLARNVTFNRLVDPGAKNGIPRFVRETTMSVWQTMWDRAPAFGSIDLTRMVLLTSTVVFFLAFAFIVVTVFVPSWREWSSSLSDGQSRDVSAGE